MIFLLKLDNSMYFGEFFFVVNLNNDRNLTKKREYVKAAIPKTGAVKKYAKG